MNIISLDIGTSGMRAVIYGIDGKKHENAYYEYHSEFPQPGYVEQDPESWKEAAVYCLSNISGYLKEDPLAITVTSQRSSLIPMKDGQPMRSAIMWQDKRTVPQCEQLIKEYTLEGLYRKTGLRTNPYFVLPKILWLKENQPEIYETAEKFIGVQDLVVHFLTGNYKTDYSQACRTLLMNIETFSWDPELLAIGGITEDRLPELVPPGSIAGELSADIAKKTGLGVGLPVIIAGGDQQNAQLRWGLINRGVQRLTREQDPLSSLRSINRCLIKKPECSVRRRLLQDSGSWRPVSLIQVRYTDGSKNSFVRIFQMTAVYITG